MLINRLECDRVVFPHTLDSTMISAFRSCAAKFFMQYVLHYKPKDESVHLVAGGAFAAGIEAARKAYFMHGMDKEEAAAVGLKALIEKYGTFECPEDSAKSLQRMCGALEYYLSIWPLGAEGAQPIKASGKVVGVELSFAEPLDFTHPKSGNPVLYTGRADLLAEFAGGVFVFDEKTTSQLGPSWIRQWELRSQFTGYCWAAAQMGIIPLGVVVRGIAILKTKYNTAEVVTYRPEAEVKMWHQQVLRDLARMKRCWEDNYWDFSLDHACVEYGGCPFSQVCKSQTPQVWLDTYFEKRVWDPMQREEISVEDYIKKWEGE